MSNEMHKKNVQAVVWIFNFSRRLEHVFLITLNFNNLPCITKRSYYNYNSFK